MVTYPTIIIVLISFLLSLGISIVCPVGSIISAISVIFVFGSGIVFSFLFYITADPKWRLWAFSNVTDIWELKRVVTGLRLISKDGSLIKKFEFRTVFDTQKLEELEAKFDEKTGINDDASIPPKTTIYYSRSVKILWPSGLFLSMYIFMLLRRDVHPPTLIQYSYPIIGAIAVGIWRGWNMFNKKPRLILSNEGIETDDQVLEKWENITKEEVYLFEFKTREWYLYYKYPSGSKNILLDRLEMNHDRISHLLYVYRNRSIPKNNSGRDVMLDAPSGIDDVQKKELGL